MTSGETLMVWWAIEYILMLMMGGWGCSPVGSVQAYAQLSQSFQFHLQPQIKLRVVAHDHNPRDRKVRGSRSS